MNECRGVGVGHRVGAVVTAVAGGCCQDSSLFTFHKRGVFSSGSWNDLQGCRARETLMNHGPLSGTTAQSTVGLRSCNYFINDFNLHIAIDCPVSTGSSSQVLVRGLGDRLYRVLAAARSNSRSSLLRYVTACSDTETMFYRFDTSWENTRQRVDVNTRWSLRCKRDARLPCQVSDFLDDVCDHCVCLALSCSPL